MSSHMRGWWENNYYKAPSADYVCFHLVVVEMNVLGEGFDLKDDRSKVKPKAFHLCPANGPQHYYLEINKKQTKKKTN